MTPAKKNKSKMGRHSRPKHIREDAKKSKPERKERKEKVKLDFFSCNTK